MKGARTGCFLRTYAFLTRCAATRSATSPVPPKTRSAAAQGQAGILYLGTGPSRHAGERLPLIAWASARSSPAVVASSLPLRPGRRSVRVQPACLRASHSGAPYCRVPRAPFAEPLHGEACVLGQKPGVLAEAVEGADVASLHSHPRLRDGCLWHLAGANDPASRCAGRPWAPRWSPGKRTCLVQGS